MKIHPKYIDVLESLDWRVCDYTNDGRVEIENYSPAGEDLIGCVEVENFPEAVYEYARDFDADEHAEMWVWHRGEGGCPSSVRELIDDADAIKEMLEKLANRLMEVE